MNRKLVLQVILYILCLYDIYLYLPDMLGLFNINYYASTADCLMYFDAVMLLMGGLIIGILLLKQAGRFNKNLGILMILVNVVFTPLFLLMALP